ncbi:MAG TPA: restriction endonuclease subunit S [Clostridiales bacterium]|nr:restriction endonuclease subunit S [Clostridiales bacterium]
MMKLGDICSFQSGGTPSRSNSKYFNGTIPWITTVALTGGVIDENSAVEFISDDAIRQSAAKIVKPYSIMVGTRVGVGKVAINSVAMSTSQDVVSLIDIDETKWNKMFLVKFIQAKNNFLNSQARGATIKGIKIEVLAELELPDIDLPTQRWIADTLDKVAEGIGLCRKMLGKLDLMVKAKFVEMFGNIPETEFVTMGSVCSLITDGTHQPPKFVDSGIPFLFVSNITTNMLTYNAEKFISAETYAELMKRTPVEIGDILLSTVGSYGHPAIVKSNKQFSFQRHIAFLKPRHNIIDSTFLHSAILTAGVQRQIEAKVKGIAQKTLNLSEIRTLRFPLPPLQEQERYAALVKNINKSKLTIQEIRDKMETEKLALMQEYFR